MFSACNAAWPRRPERREQSVIKIRSSMPHAAYQRLAANPTIHMQMRFLGSTIVRSMMMRQRVATMTPVRILVVEDYEPIRRAICSWLREREFQVMETADDLDAI